MPKVIKNEYHVYEVQNLGHISIAHKYITYCSSGAGLSFLLKPFIGRPIEGHGIGGNISVNEIKRLKEYADNPTQSVVIDIAGAGKVVITYSSEISTFFIMVDWAIISTTVGFMSMQDFHRMATNTYTSLEYFNLMICLDCGHYWENQIYKCSSCGSEYIDYSHKSLN